MQPLYTINDTHLASELFTPVKYKQIIEVAPGIKAQFFDAGHILGSAAILLEIDENNKKTRLWFSGDIGRENLPLLEDPVLPFDVDYLIMECTYGDKPHRNPEIAFDEFRQVVKRTISRGGKVIIPAFAVGRTQEIVYFLNRMIAFGDIPAIPVYVDSPLAVNASDIFRQYAYMFDDETRSFVENGKHKALSFPNLHYTRSVEKSKKINDVYEPMIIISASGMAETGRILHHFKK